jgi:threonine/homoserine/homoserine lactone efflux protein
MFDARYFAYATISALLVISPGATMAVVLETVMGEGRLAALFTVVGINIGNSTLALASALGMSVLFHAWPSALNAVKWGGAAYLTYLGLRGVWFAWRGHPPAGAGADPRNRQIAKSPNRRIVSSGVYRGIITNLLNPPVVLFYMTFLPQFIGPQDPFFARFLVLAGTHVGMSLVWLSFYAFALGVLADRFARPAVRRTLEGLTGALLVGFGARLLIR